MRTLKHLTELGFINIFRPSVDETFEVMYEQIEGKTDLAAKVLDELHDWHAPYIVHKDNYDDVLQDWVEEQANALHSEETPESDDQTLARLISELDAHYRCRTTHCINTVMRAKTIAASKGEGFVNLSETGRTDYFFKAVYHLAVEAGISID